MATNAKIGRYAGWTVLFWIMVVGSVVSPIGLEASDFPKVYVAHSACIAESCPPDVLSVIDVHTDKVVATLKVGQGPVFAAPTPDGRQVYVVNASSGDITVIDAIHDIETTTIPVGSGPQAVAFRQDGRRAYVTNFFDGTVSVISVTKKKVTATVPVGAFPGGLLVVGHKLFVTNSADGTVSVINTLTNEVMATIPVGQSPIASASTRRSGPGRWHHDLSLVFVANFDDGTLSVIDPRSKTVMGDPIRVGDGPLALAAAADGRLLYIANFLSKDVSVVRTETLEVVGTIPVDGQPVDLALTSNGRRLLILHIDPDGVLPGGLTILDTKKMRHGQDLEHDQDVERTQDLEHDRDPVLAVIPVGQFASDIVLARGKAYVPNSDGGLCGGADLGTVSAIDAREGQLDNTIAVGPCPFVGTAVEKPDKREDKPHHGKRRWQHLLSRRFLQEDERP